MIKFDPIPAGVGPVDAKLLTRIEDKIKAAFGLAQSAQDVTNIFDSLSTGGIVTVANASALASLDLSTLEEGNLIYVQTFRAWFAFVLSSAVVSAGTRYSSKRKGYQFVRVMESTSWWSQLLWNIDPANSAASDENTGLTGAPLATYAELRRRMRGRFLPNGETVAITVNQLSDAADSDPLMFDATSVTPVSGSSTITLVGSVTILGSGVIASAVAKNAATNTSNQITITGFDWSTYVGKVVRLQGTTGTNATIAVVEKDLGSGQCRLGEQCLGISANVGSGFTAGQTVEVVQGPKCAGIATGDSFLIAFASYINFNPASSVRLSSAGAFGLVTTFACELRGTSLNVSTPQAQFFGSSIMSNTATLIGSSQNTCLSIINTTVTLQGTSVREQDHWVSCGLQASEVIVDGNVYFRANSDFHCFDLPANAIGISVFPTALCWFAAAYYGSGNSASSVGIALTFGVSRALYGGNAALTMDAGTGLRVGSVSPTNHTFASLPFGPDASDNAMLQAS